MDAWVGHQQKGTWKRESEPILNVKQAHANKHGETAPALIRSSSVDWNLRIVKELRAAGALAFVTAALER
jgi:hypothetical protein